MALCIAGSMVVSRIAAVAFTLAWTHSVEKTRWEEDWRIENASLQIVEARVEGSGAGMEPGPGARYDGRFWRWRPPVGPQREVKLRRSHESNEGWSLCSSNGCHIIGASAGSSETITLTACGS